MSTLLKLLGCLTTLSIAVGTQLFTVFPIWNLYIAKLTLVSALHDLEETIFKVTQLRER